MVQSQDDNSNLTNTVQSTQLITDLFDKYIVPLNASQAKDSLDLTGFSAPRSSALHPVDGTTGIGQFSGATAGTLITEMTKLAELRGDEGLTVLGPYLVEIAKALAEEDVSHSGDVDVFCYTMF